MRLDRYISKKRIIDIQSSTLEGAINELLMVCPLVDKGAESRGELLKLLIDREKSMTTYLGNGIALPHARIAMKKHYMFAIGRCPSGLEYEGLEEYRDLKLVVLLLASEKENSYLKVLASLASILQDEDFINSLKTAVTLEEFQDHIIKGFGSEGGLPQGRGSKFNRLMLNECGKIAKGADCGSIMLFGDTFSKGFNIGKTFENFRTILVTQGSPDVSSHFSNVDVTISTKAFSKNRFAQMKSAVLIGISRGLIEFNEKICCIAGRAKSDILDTIAVVDVRNEFQAVFDGQSDILPPFIKPEVMERVLAIATELAVEGREGKPVGCLFVLGDVAELKPFIKPLILNPFYGYKDEDRNILNPFMDETMKEFSTIDGAFIIRGDGVVESAGSLLHAPEFIHSLPSGLGTRHAAGSAISQAADCVAIAVSASTRQVTIFRRGQMLPLM